MLTLTTDRAAKIASVRAQMEAAEEAMNAALTAALGGLNAEKASGTVEARTLAFDIWTIVNQARANLYRSHAEMTKAVKASLSDADMLAVIGPMGGGGPR